MPTEPPPPAVTLRAFAHPLRLRLLSLAEEVPVQGGRALRYRHDPDSGPASAQGGTEDLRMLAAALAEELERRARRRDPGPPRSFTDTEVWIAPRSGLRWSTVGGGRGAAPRGAAAALARDGPRQRQPALLRDAR